MRKRNVPGILAKRLAGALGVCALIFGGSSMSHGTGGTGRSL